jgi:hypothetical protein
MNEFIHIIRNTYELYFQHGAQSSKKTDFFHRYIQTKINEHIASSSIYKCHLEHKVASVNASGNKRCDIVITKHDEPFVVFPVKIVMSNYKQNKNNAWENLTGELQHLVWANPDIKIVPINVILNQIPYLDSKQIIKKYEEIVYDDTYKIYEILTDRKICYRQMNYILDVVPVCEVGSPYNKCPDIVGFNSKTPFIPISDILSDCLV